MKTADAVREVLESKRLTKYALAKQLDCSPTSVNQWLAGTCMSTQYADRFEGAFGIHIDDQVYTGRL